MKLLLGLLLIESLRIERIVRDRLEEKTREDENLIARA